MQDKFNSMKAGHSDTEKRVQDSKTEQVYIIRSQHINPQGRLFGGYLMQWIDEHIHGDTGGYLCGRL